MSNSYLAPRPLFSSPQPVEPRLPVTDRVSTVGFAASERESGGLTQCLRALYRRKVTLLLISLSVVLVAAITSLAQPRLYRSVAILVIEGANENLLNLRDTNPASVRGAFSNQVYVKTEAEILQDDALLEQTAEKLQLARRAEFRPQSEISPLVAERYAVESAKKNLKIEPSRDSQIIRVAFEARDPQLAADFVNTLAQTFIDQSVEARRGAALQIQEWLGPRIQELRSKLQTSEAELNGYLGAAGLMLVPGQDTLAAGKLRTLQEELSRAQAELVEKQAQAQLIDNSPTEVTTENSTIREYDVRLTDLRRQLADLESILQPQSYKVVRLQAQIAQLEAAIGNEVRRIHQSQQRDFLTAEKRALALAAAYAQQSTVVSKIADKMTHYNALKHEVDTNRQSYEAMLQKVNEAGIASAMRQSNIRLVAPAAAAVRPYKPNLPLNLGIGLIAGLVLAIGFVLVSEQTNSRLRAPGDVGLYLNLPELGTIPSAASLEPRLQKLLGSKSIERAVERITWEQRFSKLSEAFRATVASILSSEQNGNRLDALVVTSPLPGEGKTTIASNLGIALAEIRGRVLLIDGDMRRPRLHDIFGLANSWGLSNILREQNATEELPLDALVKKTGVPRLYLLPSGPCTDSIFSLLCSERMGRLMSRFRQEFDYVIVDAPPCLEFADARILARHSEGVLLVLRADYADKKLALATAQRLSLDGVPVVGTILNQWDPVALGEAYGYGSYGKSYDQAKS